MLSSSTGRIYLAWLWLPKTSHLFKLLFWLVKSQERISHLWGNDSSALFQTNTLGHHDLSSGGVTLCIDQRARQITQLGHRAEVGGDIPAALKPCSTSHFLCEANSALKGICSSSFLQLPHMLSSGISTESFFPCVVLLQVVTFTIVKCAKKNYLY